jgi:hypothetical protein
MDVAPSGGRLHPVATELLPPAGEGQRAPEQHGEEHLHDHG